MSINHKNILTTACILAILAILPSAAQATIYRGINFPDGPISFTDSVIQYNPSYSNGNVPTNTNYTDPTKAIGIPDYVNPTGSVSLGSGGLLELQFDDNFLTNSNSANPDLHIFEVGPDVEDTFVAIKPTPATLAILGLGALDDANSDGFFDIGKVFGSTSSIDIDAIPLFAGHTAGTLRFSAVQLIDDPNEGGRSGATVGADIDAVGAITSAVPEPTTIATLTLLTLTTLTRRSKP